MTVSENACVIMCVSAFAPPLCYVGGSLAQFRFAFVFWYIDFQVLVAAELPLVAQWLQTIEYRGFEFHPGDLVNKSSVVVLETLFC